MLEGVSQTQPISPPILAEQPDSDEEGAGSGFGIVAVPDSRPAKKLKVQVNSTFKVV